MMSMTLGSLIGAAVLTAGVNETYFYVVLASMALVASLSFLFIRKPLPYRPVTAPVNMESFAVRDSVLQGEYGEGEGLITSGTSSNGIAIQRSTVMADSQQSLIPVDIDDEPEQSFKESL